MVKIPKFKVLEATVFSRQIKTRMPFRFGRSTMTQMPIMHLHLKVRVDSGKVVDGVSALSIPPLWFDKAAGKTHMDNINDLSISLRIALEHYLEMDEAPVWFLHSITQPNILKIAARKGFNDLTAGFGIALVDLALIDAACRHTGMGLHQSLQENILGFGSDFAELIPKTPLEKVALRHTIGLADPIHSSDITEPIGDGLPESLEEVLKEYHASYFKIKISGDASESLDRLRRIASVLDADGGDYKTTLDGNEQFQDMDSFAMFMRTASGDPSLQTFWNRTLWIEQPVGRSHSLLDSVIEPLKEISLFKPVIIDESDGADDSLERALALGYCGTSAKNCKGIFRTLHSYKLLQQRISEGKFVPILSSEDLTSTPTLALQQDLSVAAALGIEHSERNGQHYIVGFDFLSPRERADALHDFPSLYKTRKNGNPVVKIENGFLVTKEVNRIGFGGPSLPEWENLEPVRLPEIPEDIISDIEGVIHE